MEEQLEVPNENKYVSNIRQKIRHDIRVSQLKNRLSTNDRQRYGLSELSSKIRKTDEISEKDVQGLASRIKRRKAADSNDLIRLSAGFVNNPKNIETFTKIPGALNVIIKEFTGNSMLQQILAGECLCNMASGDDISSKKIAQAAGSYLLMFLDLVSNKVLAETCFWTIQNLILSGKNTQKTLLAQGLPEKLFTLMQTLIDQDLIKDTQETLAILVNEAWSDLSDEYILKVIKMLSMESVFYALYSIFMEKNFFVSSEVLDPVIQFSVEKLITANQENLATSKNFSTFLISIRIIANTLLTGNASEFILKCISDHILGLIDFVNAIILTENEQIRHEALWMMSALYKYFDKNVLEQNLKIPTKYL